MIIGANSAGPLQGLAFDAPRHNTSPHLLGEQLPRISPGVLPNEHNPTYKLSRLLALSSSDDGYGGDIQVGSGRTEVVDPDIAIQVNVDLAVSA